MGVKVTAIMCASGMPGGRTGAAGILLGCNWVFSFFGGFVVVWSKWASGCNNEVAIVVWCRVLSGAGRCVVELGVRLYS